VVDAELSKAKAAQEQLLLSEARSLNEQVQWSRAIKGVMQPYSVEENAQIEKVSCDA
jgi:hypothetical protein